ncbi:MAG: hypothetical protein LBO72_03930 [Helicobacteraceae bacterium]|jgi:hypothetical protein|nr:hypothetical protein [Helicobacteraceae bacterium]
MISDLFFTFIFMACGALFGDDFMYSKTSPNGEHTIEVYTERRAFAMPGDGGIGSRSAIIVLKDKNGKIIGRSNDECSVFYYDVDIEWDYPNNEVNFARARSINLTTGKCLY